MNSKKGCIYILKNPSFPKFVKIGYADDVYQRLNQLNRSECIPYAFRLYAYYEVSSRLTDIKLHQMIDKLNPELRAIEDFNGKKRVREFYAMDAEEAYGILETIAELNGMQDHLHLVEPSLNEKKAEEEAAEIIGLPVNRHHIKDCIFKSSLTGKTYKGTTSETGVLIIIDMDSNCEIPNNSNPSKKAIVSQAIIDYGGVTDKGKNLYQLYRELTKLVGNNSNCNEKNSNNITTYEKHISVNDIRAKIIRVPAEIASTIINNEIQIELGDEPIKKYKFTKSGKFISGVSDFFIHNGIVEETGKVNPCTVIWIVNENKIKVKKNGK